ncbi:hypothetical protein ACLH0K_13950 [Arthrobacter sp. MPF02]|uniref:hypothetical protein n=1 Tax=Arthrobacter sp. MPF02 TaxID=3388492 RepID=UPI00398559CD
MIRTALQRLTGAAVAVSLLAGCSAPDLDGEVATRLQQRVAAAKGFAVGQDYPAALAELEQLSRDVTAAAGQGRVSEPRKGRIDAAITTIRNDLEAAMAAAAPTPPTPPAPTSPAAVPPVTEDQKEREEEARKEAEEAREEAQKEAEEAREKAEKEREEAQKEAEKQRNGG